MNKTPLNQVRLTNVALVKYKIKGKKFELACYKNKVQNYRDNVETDLNEVLQINEIYTNVSKGEVANGKDVKKYLHEDKQKAIEIIMTKGELQISELERDSEFESMKLKIANIVSTMCVNKKNNVPFPVPIILKAMDDIKFNVKDSHAAKKQALQLIKELPKVLPLERAKMKIKFSCTDSTKSAEVIDWMTKKYDKEENDEEGKIYLLEKTQTVENEQVELTYLILPRIIRDITDLWNKDKDLTSEIVEHYVYSRLVSEEEKKEAEEMYKAGQKDSEEEFKESTVTIVSQPKKEQKKSNDTKEGEITWTYCKDANFETKEEFKSHYKTEWHIENTVRKMNGKPQLSHDEYLTWKEDEIDKEMFAKNKKVNKNKDKRKKQKNQN